VVQEFQHDASSRSPALLSVRWRTQNDLPD